MKNLYRIERIYYPAPQQVDGENVESQNNENRRNFQAQVVLENIVDDSTENTDEQKSIFEIYEINSDKLKLNTGTRLYEGMFVYFNNSNRTFTSGRLDPRAKKLMSENKQYRKYLIDISNNDIQNEDGYDWYKGDDNLYDVTSFHVNVGHGNCSIILIRKDTQYRIWMVDCGMIDYLTHKSYQRNIDNAFDVIAKIVRVNNENLKIDRFYLTHWHYDHYSGLEYLIQSKRVTSSTIFCMNLYYSVYSKSVNNILKLLYGLKILCYEPISTLHKLNNTIILYPECRIQRYATHGHAERVERYVNNSSVVYCITFAGRTMVLPGDLEQDGLKRMISNCLSFTHYINYYCVNYYCVSHHASSNGDIFNAFASCRRYVRNRCHFECCLKYCAHAIVMGRDGAYSGIYDYSVINSFSHKVSFSEFDYKHIGHRGVAINWGTGSCYSI